MPDIATMVVGSIVAAVVTWLLKSVYTMSRIVNQELKTNGGNSLKDKVNKVCSDVNSHTSKIISKLNKLDEDTSITKSTMKAMILLSELGFFETDKHGRFIYVNQRWSEITGILPYETVDDGWFASVHPDDKQQVIKSWVNMVTTGQEFNEKYRILKPDGTSVMIYSRCFPAKTSENNVVGYIGTIKKI